MIFDLINSGANPTTVIALFICGIILGFNIRGLWESIKK